MRLSITPLFLLAVFLVSMTTSACGPRAWMTQKIYSPAPGGVIAHVNKYDSRENAKYKMMKYCLPGEVKLITEWDGTQEKGQYQFTIGEDNQLITVSLDTGWGYIAFICVK